MWVGRLTCSPAGALRARPAICGALGRASVNSDAANQRSPNYVDPFHREVPKPKSAAPKTRSVKPRARHLGARSRLLRPRQDATEG